MMEAKPVPSPGGTAGQQGHMVPLVFSHLVLSSRLRIKQETKPMRGLPALKEVPLW